MCEKQKVKTVSSLDFTWSYSQMIMQKEVPKENKNSSTLKATVNVFQ